MEIKILEQTKTRLKIEIIGEDHTLSNAIRDALWRNKHIIAAGYQIEHPITSNPILIIETDDKENAKKALLSAIDDLKAQYKQLGALIKNLK